MTTWLNFGKQLITELNKHRITGLAAEQAYYYLLSVFPMLILLLSILPYLSINSQVVSDFSYNFLPIETAQLIKETFISLINERNRELLTFSIIGTIWSASNGINAFIHSMNIAFDVQETRNFFINRLLSIIMTFGLIIAFIIALILPVFGNILLDLLNQLVLIPDEVQRFIHVLRWGVAVIIISIILAYLYKVAPNIQLSFKEVFIGAVTATILWLLVSLGFSFYVNNFGNYSATYGSLGGVIVLMLWLYLTGMSLIIGGEINAILYRHIHVIRPQKMNSHFL